MVNEALLFEKAKIRSTKLDKDIELDVYTKEDKKIIRTLSLIAAFNSVREQFGAQITKEIGDISHDANGNPVYCLSRVTITDNSGYSETFYGESLPSTRLNQISASHPFNTAENRAVGKAIRRYLGLPTEAYSSDEIPVDNESPESSAEDTKNLLKKLGEKKKAEDKPEKPKVPEGVEAAPIEETVADEPEAVAEPKIETAPIEDVPEETAEPVEDEAVEEAKEPEVKPEAKAEKPKAEKKAKKADTNIVDATYGAVVVSFGPGKGKTVEEICNDKACERFVDTIVSGKAKMPENDPERASMMKAIIEYMRGKKSA